ncbi:zinc finger protein ZAT9-like [Cucurbita pepo subsp. pepo]|uniref:zinc finger protein ZAT9-like n=1 Tax=Cucurbita pepo subsp. pepo TaxID=3664 RepID=UPI000C9DA039|nr:zinc finger protein ZAT9-like [Cucurbita pepo subsp. pepo]
MDRHKCRLCFRSFSNGRALGGHMRSHLMNLPLPPKPEDPPPPHAHLSEDADSASFLSSPSSSEGDAEEKGLGYGLRENPKRSIRVVDPEFSFAVDAGSVVLQDRESETESSKNPTRRRSKRTRKLDHHHHQHVHEHHHYSAFKRLQEKKVNQPESWTEAEQVSSISGSTTEQDVAFWLMMLSRDKWTKQRGGYEEDEEEEEEEEDNEDEEEEEVEESMEETDDSEALKFPKNRNRGNYKCETCNKVFRSYQALGGHRASHKKIKLSVTYNNPQLVTHRENAASMGERKIHECPVCFRVFSSGQALGGHKRSHVTAYSSPNSIPPKTPPPKKLGDSFIDLNLPAPFEEDDVSQIELSAVSDADFVNAIRQ